MANKFRQEKYIQQICNKGCWTFRVRLNNTSKYFSEKDYLDARQAYKAAINYRNNLVIDPIVMPTNKTIYDVMEESFDLLLVRQKTRINHTSLFNNYITEKISIDNFDEGFVYRKLNAIVGTKSDDVIKRVYNVFCRIDKTCLIRKYYTSSVMISVVCPKSHLITNKEIKVPINKEDLEKVKQGCANVQSTYEQKQFPLILDFFYNTGCRPCEVWCLTWDDIKNDMISINKEVGSDKSNLGVIRPPKTNLSNRTIPITPSLKTSLKEAKNLSKCNLVFPNKDGGMYDTDLIGRRFKAIAKKQNIDFNLYDLRHRFATDLTNIGIDDRTKMELMGHKNISMTLDYARSDNDRKKDALLKRN